MQRESGDPSGDFVGPQTLFAWDLHSQWMQTLQNTYGNQANSNKTLRKSKKGSVRTAF